MKRSRRRSGNLLIVLATCLAAPLSMGGCPSFRNELVGVLETAFIGYVEEWITGVFDRLREDG